MAAVALVLLILSILLIVILIKRAKTKLENVPSNKLQAQTISAGTVIYTESKSDSIPVEVNEAYATTASTQGNVAYITTEIGLRADYEDYHYS